MSADCFEKRKAPGMKSRIIVTDVRCKGRCQSAPVVSRSGVDPREGGEACGTPIAAKPNDCAGSSVVGNYVDGLVPVKP
jgi:hypothetical protein